MKARCSSVQRNLSDYMDRMLSGRRTVIVADHLRSCAACRRELESLKRTKALLHNFYVEPDAPNSYYDRFWLQFQDVIEERPRPIWWRSTVLWQTFACNGQDALDRFTDFCSSFITTPVQSVFRWARFSPLYTFILALMTTLFFVSYFSQIQERPWQLSSSQLRNSLRAYPVHLMQLQKNRELVRKREKIPGIPQAFSEQFAHTAQKASQLGRTEILVEDLDGHISTHFVSDSNMLWKVIIDNDIFPDLHPYAQLSDLESLLAREDFSIPLGVVKNPFQEKFERENRQSNGLIEVMDVPLRSLSITEVYDSVKL